MQVRQAAFGDLVILAAGNTSWRRTVMPGVEPLGPARDENAHTRTQTPRPVDD